jgi:hypothetical protein
MSIALDYLYRDAANWKTSEFAYLAGDLTDEQIETLNELAGEPVFIPGQIGLPDLQENLGSLDENSHVWHEIVSVERSGFAPTVGATAQEFYEAATRGQQDDFWDVPGAMREVGILDPDINALVSQLRHAPREEWKPIISKYMEGL